MRGLSTSRAARVRNMIKPISRARRGKCWVTLLVRSPDVDDESPLIFRMIVRAPPPLPSVPPRDRVEVVIPVRHRTFSRRSTPSLMLLPLLFIGRSSLPPLSPFLLSPCFPLFPQLSPIQPSSPIQPPSGNLVDLVGPLCLPPPQLPRPAPQLGSKSSTSPSKRRSVSTVSTVSSAPSSSRLKPSFTTLSTPSIPLCPRDQ